MQQIEDKILSSLIDKYESSKLSRSENVHAIHITFPFRKSTIPKYFDESSLVSDDINEIMQQLEREGLILIQWKNKRCGHIIDKVVLCENEIDNVYKKLGRTPKNKAEEETLQLLRKTYDGTSGSVTKSFASRMIKRITEGKTVKEYLDIMDIHGTKQLIYALTNVEQNKSECYIREFSIEYFRDSKTFETLIPKICKIIREEKEEFEDYENDDILAEYQIYRTPGYVYVKGDVRLSTNTGSEIDISVFPDGIAFALGNLPEETIRVIPGASVKNIYTIENLTSFYRFQKPDSVIVYLGGYHNSSRRKLLEEIYAKRPDASYYHFGDIDVGGFQIYYHLKEKTGIPFETFRMDIDTIKKYEMYAKPLTENDRRRLRKLIDTKMSGSEKMLAEYMLERGIKLEQECIIDCGPHLSTQ